jgi:hypothetical protein
MFRLLGVLSTVALCAVTVRSADPLPFKEFASKGGRYKVLMPGKVETSEAKANGLDTFTASVTVSGTVFSVTYFDFACAVPADKAQELLQTLTKTTKGKLISDMGKSLGKDKIPAREAVSQEKNIFLRHLVVLHGQRLDQVIIAGPTKDAVTSKDADKFIASFEVVK